MIAYADPTPLPKGTNPNGSTFDPDGGDWSTYWYNGKIDESDIYRGMMVWDLDNTYTNRANTVDELEPADADRPDRGRQREADDHHRRPLAGGQFLQNSAQPANFTCADEGLGVESCVGTVASGANVEHGRDRLPHVQGHRDRPGRQRDGAGNPVRGQLHGA